MKILTAQDSTLWEKICHSFQPLGLNDIYFHPNYISLYVDEGEEMEAYLHQAGGETFFFPYIKRKIYCDGELYYDFETAYGYGGPLASTECPDFLNESWRGFLEQARQQKLFAGFIRFHPLLQNEKFATTETIKIHNLCPTVKLSLNQDVEQILRQYRSDIRNKINKAKKNELYVKQLKGTEALLKFASIYRKTMVNANAKDFYFFDDAYFINIAEKLVNYHNVYLAYQGTDCIGGVLTLHSEDYVHLHLSATERETQKYGTANILRHEAILSNLKDKKVFHFGGGVTHSSTDPLLKFKKGFSQEESCFSIGKVMIDHSIYDKICQKWQDEFSGNHQEFEHIFLKYRF